MTTDTATTASARRTTSPAGVIAPPSKSEIVIKLLLRGKGATLPELITATEWQAHSVRALLSGLRKRGRLIVREARKCGDVAYRIEVAAKPAIDGVTAAVAAPAASDTVLVA